MKKILVIDDDEQFRVMLKVLLEHQGYSVILAFDGNNGFAKFGEESPDLVITDIIMPEQEGIETIGKIRKANKNIPIIAVSGGGRSGPDSYLPLARGLGASKTFSKPFDREEFLGAVTECLG